VQFHNKKITFVEQSKQLKPVLKQKSVPKTGKLYTQQAYKSAAQQSPRNSDDTQHLNIQDDYSQGPTH
jgi:hypothetical protein